LRAWLQTYGGKVQTCKYKRIAALDDATGLPFVVEIAFAGRQDRKPRRLLTGINFAPTLADPFRKFEDYGLGLEGQAVVFELSERIRESRREVDSREEAPGFAILAAGERDLDDEWQPRRVIESGDSFVLARLDLSTVRLQPGPE